jgi:hypothetical protein
MHLYRKESCLQSPFCMRPVLNAHEVIVPPEIDVLLETTLCVESETGSLNK